MSGLTGLAAKARSFAIAAHGAQRYGDNPYVVHLDAVVALLCSHGFSDEQHLAAGYLHDVLEDTPTERQALLPFGEEVTAAVAFCSDEPGDSRKVRKAATYARMARDVRSQALWVPLAIRVKVADRLANVMASAGENPLVPASSRLLKMYRREHPTFVGALNVPGVCDEMWDALAARLR